jgi:hypothetical protein
VDKRTVLIGSTGTDHVLIQMSGRSDTEFWLEGSVNVAVDVWRGTVPCGFQTGELRDFATQLERLYRDLRGVARLSPLDPYLNLEFIGDGRGHIQVNGKAQNRMPGPVLTFDFQIEQTELPAIIAALKEADPNSGSFPAKGR